MSRPLLITTPTGECYVRVIRRGRTCGTVVWYGTVRQIRGDRSSRWVLV